MKGIWGTTAKNNEEYKEVIKKRMKLMVLLIIIGAITAAVGFGSEFCFNVTINEHMIGVYTGVGVGLFVAGLILWIKNKIVLGNEAKLKESRLGNTDERILEISNKAFRIATFAMIAAMYVVALIGGLFYPILVEVLLFIVCMFLVAYVIAYKYYNSKM